MAQVVNKSQQVVTGGLKPGSAYSRVISVNMALDPDDVWRFAVSPSVGLSVRLLKVQIWFRAKAANVNQWTEFEVVSGSVFPNTIGGMDSWERILPVYDQTGAVGLWRCYDGRDNFSWDMCKIYSGQARRFGIVAMRSTNWGEDSVYASFHISEG